MLNMKVLTFSGVAGGHNLMSPYLGQKAILPIISKLANHVVPGDLPEGKGSAGEFHEEKLRAEVGFLNSALISHAPSAMLLLWTIIALKIPNKIGNSLSFQILECDL